MNTLRRAAATISVLALAAVPVGVASASNSHAGQHGDAGEHGNHCGLGHTKHVKGHGGSKVGQKCVKAPHGEGSGDTD